MYLGDERVGTSILIDDQRKESCEPLSEHCSSEWLVLPARPILFGVFQFVYLTNRSVEEFRKNVAPDFVCFNAQQCPKLLESLIPRKILDGLICSSISNLITVNKIRDFKMVEFYFCKLGEQCLKTGVDQSCTNPSDFYCSKSMKCISFNRVGDGKTDCFYSDDELFDACQLNQSNRFICKSEKNKSLMPTAVGNGLYDCTLGEDEILTYTQNLTDLIPFHYSVMKRSIISRS